MEIFLICLGGFALIAGGWLWVQEYDYRQSMRIYDYYQQKRRGFQSPDQRQLHFHNLPHIQLFDQNGVEIKMKK